MALWNMETDAIAPGQWLKGGVELCDVSPDGRYVAYVAQTFHRSPPSYFAVSRPPYLKALLFQPVVHVLWCDALFLDERTYEWVGAPLTKGDWGGNGPHNLRREVVGNPLRRKPWRGERWPDRRLLDLDAKRPAILQAVERYGPAANRLLTTPRSGQGIFPAADSLLTEAKIATWDVRGRLIVDHGWRLVAFSEDEPQGVELFDLSDRTFEHVAAPRWAGGW